MQILDNGKIAIRIIPKNRILLKYLQNNNLTIKQFGEICKINYVLLVNIINCNVSYLREDLQPRKYIKRISDITGYHYLELLPPKEFNKLKEIENKWIEPGIKQKLLTENDILKKIDAEKILNEIFKLFAPREREILIDRFINQKSLSEITNKYNVTKARIYQIEMKALKKIHHNNNPRIDKKLKELKNIWINYD